MTAVNDNFTNPLTTNERNTLITDSTANADVKSALLRPDDSPKGDSDLAVNVRPFNEHSTEETDDDDYDTNHDEFRDNDNNNDNDYSEDEEEEDEPDELAGVTG